MKSVLIGAVLIFCSLISLSAENVINQFSAIDSYSEKKDGGEIYPLGFSKNGYFAYISRYYGPECGYCPKFIVSNLITDKKIIEKQYYPENAISGFVIHKKEVSELLVKYKIEFSHKTTLQQFPYNYNGKTIDASLGPDYKLILKSNVKRKVVADLPEPIGYTEEVGSYNLIGFFLSPFENRIAIVVQRKISGWEAEPENESFIYGAHLEKRF
ncbi:MAG: hypothetical protein HKM93_21215 [Desulfobacteraceae bacterium]|nr:hypothetical protein [Desulfobacteraceae bacterium]